LSENLIKAKTAPVLIDMKRGELFYNLMRLIIFKIECLVKCQVFLSFYKIYLLVKLQIIEILHIINFVVLGVLPFLFVLNLDTESLEPTETFESNTPRDSE
jgi:hypothetical protein